MPRKQNIEKIFHGAAGFASSVVSNLMPSTVMNKAKGKKAGADADTIRKARSYGNAPNFNDDGSPTDAFKARSLSEGVKIRRMKK